MTKSLASGPPAEPDPESAIAPGAGLRSTDRNDPSAAADAESRTLADVLVEYLAGAGLGPVFGIPGGAIEPLYDALARSARTGGPSAVVARHETGAAFMADGYHRATGRTAACCATTGPGTTNLVTGVASAAENRVPLLVLTAQTALSTFGRGAFQESSCTGIDTVRLLAGCTRYSTLVSHPDQLEPKLIAALQAARRHPRGPVHLSLPRDVLAAAAGPRRYTLDATAAAPGAASEAPARWLADALGTARAPVFVVGEACADDPDAVLAVARATGARVVSTPHAVGAVPTDTPGYRGVIGFAGHPEARAAVADPETDLVVAVGTCLSEWASDGWDPALVDERLVHVDPDATHFERSPMARRHLAADIAPLFARVLRLLPPGPGGAFRPQWIAPAASEPDRPGTVHPARLVEWLLATCPEGARIHPDTGNAIAWLVHVLGARGTRASDVRARTSLEFAAMGWAIGAAIGASIGDPGRTSVCLAGDGAWLLSGQELTVAVRHRLPVVFIILNDGALGMVMHGQRLSGAEPIGFTLPATDFAALARAHGADAVTVHDTRDLEGFDPFARSAMDGPLVIDARVDPEAVPPMHARVRTLRAANRRAAT